MWEQKEMNWGQPSNEGPSEGSCWRKESGGEQDNPHDKNNSNDRYNNAEDTASDGNDFAAGCCVLSVNEPVEPGATICRASFNLFRVELEDVDMRDPRNEPQGCSGTLVEELAEQRDTGGPHWLPTTQAPLMTLRRDRYTPDYQWLGRAACQHHRRG